MSRFTRRRLLTALGASTVHLAARGPARLESSAHVAPRGARADARFLIPDGAVFLNTGSLGACPEVVIERTREAWLRLERAPVHEGFGPLKDEADEARKRAAAFLGAGEDELCVTHNTTDGMHLVAEGVALAPGDRVLTTDHEHAGGLRCWQYAERRRGVVIDRVTLPTPADDVDEVVDRFRRAMRPETRVVSVSHVAFTTGLRLPVRRLADVAHERGALLVVDGAQSAGAIRVDVESLGCDAYATSAHKWMLAPKGLGLLYIRAAARRRIDPARLADGPAVYTGATGSPPLPAIVGLGAAVDFLAELGPAAIEQHDLALRDRLYDALSAIDGLEVVSPPPGPLASPLVSVAFPERVDHVALRARLLERHGVSVKRIPASHFAGLRFSTHMYNTRADVDALLGALEAELAG